MGPIESRIELMAERISKIAQRVNNYRDRINALESDAEANRKGRITEGQTVLILAQEIKVMKDRLNSIKADFVGKPSPGPVHVTKWRPPSATPVGELITKAMEVEPRVVQSKDLPAPPGWPSAQLVNEYATFRWGSRLGDDAEAILDLTAARSAMKVGVLEARLEKLTLNCTDLKNALHEISLASQSSMASKEQCGVIARTTIASVEARKP